MAFPIMISSGVEKFYSLPQFFTVLILTVSMILSVIILVFISSHMNRGRRKNLFIFFMIDLIIFQFSETGIIVSPTPNAVHFWVIFNSIVIFFVTRSFFLFCHTLQKTDKFPVKFGIIIAVELLLYGLILVFPMEKLQFFSTISFNNILPGMVFWLFLAESISWMLLGVVNLTMNRTNRKQKSNALKWMILGTVLFCGGLFLHHFLFWDYSAFIIPSSVLLSILCWMRSIISFNLFGLFLDSFEEIIRVVSGFIVIASTDGRIITSNRDNYRFWNISGCKTVPDLIKSLKEHAIKEPGKDFLSSVESLRFDRVVDERLTLIYGNDTMHLVCSIQPVRYWRKNIAWMLTFQDISEEEEDIKSLMEHEKILSRKYEELQIYQKAGLYLEFEKNREKIIQKVHAEMNNIIHRLMDNSIFPDDNTEVEKIIRMARQGLFGIRKAMNQLKHLEGEKLQ